MTAGPIRVAVLANSDGLTVAVRDRSPNEPPYPLLLADLLKVDGVRADVRNCSRVMGMVPQGVLDWEERAWTHWPHLVVLQYGVQESYPWFFPPPVHRRAWGLQRTDRPIDRRLNGLLQARWSLVQKASRDLDRPWMRGQMSLARFRSQYNRLVNLSLAWSGAVVIGIGMHPPNFRLMKLAGAYPARRARMQPVIEAALDNPRCGYVDFQDVLDAVDPDFEKSMPDGLHLVPKGHMALAQLIADKYWSITARLGQSIPQAVAGGE
jgi:lysophospholipase L1-like esterase